MKKKILIGIMTIATLGAILLTGCSSKKVDGPGKGDKADANKETITIKEEFDNIDYHVVTLNYDKKIKLETEDGSYGYTVKNEKADYKMKFVICQDTTYDSNKDYAKEYEEGYKEEKIGKYKGYSYIDSDSEQDVYLMLKENKDQDVYLTIDIVSISGDTKGKDLFKSDEVQNILSSLEYKGTEKIVYENPDVYESRNVSVNKFDVDTKDYKMEFVRNVDDVYINIDLIEGEDTYVSTISVMSLEDDEDKASSEKYYKDPKECKKSATKIGGINVTKYQHLERAYGYDKSDVLYYEKDGKWMYIHACYNKDVDEKMIYTIVEKIMENAKPLEAE